MLSIKLGNWGEILQPCSPSGTLTHRKNMPMYLKDFVIQLMFISWLLTRLLSRSYTLLNKTTSYIFQEMLKKTSLLKVLENFQKKLFSRVPFYQWELSNLPCNMKFKRYIIKRKFVSFNVNLFPADSCFGKLIWP